MMEKRIDIYNNALNVIAVRCNDDAKYMSRKSYYIVSASNYNVFIRDGKIIGMPRPYGGAIYPHSKDCINPPSLFSPKYTSFSFVIIPKDTLIKFTWNFEIIITHPVSGKAFPLKLHLPLSPAFDYLEVPETMDRFMAVYNLARARKYGLSTVACEEYTTDDWKSIVGNDAVDVFKEHFLKYLEEVKVYFRNCSSVDDIDVTPFVDSMHTPFDRLFVKYALTLPSFFYNDFTAYVKSVLKLIFEIWSKEK